MASIQQSQQEQIILVSSMQQIQSLHSQHKTSLRKTAQVSATAVSNMCVECGCDKFGSETGINKVPGGMLDVTRDGEAGLTLNMTASNEERLRFINE